MDIDFSFNTGKRSLIKILFMREIREAFASRHFWLVLAFCLILVPLSFEVGIRDYQARLQSYREALRMYKEETQTILDVIFKEGAKAFAVPSPLSFLSDGLEPVLPNVAEFQFKSSEPPAIVRFNNNQGIDNIYEFFFGPFDLVFIVGVVMSFLAIIMTYGAVAGEKEQGTLKQVLSNSIPRTNILVAKAAAHGAILIVPFFLGLILTFAMLEIQGVGLSIAGASISIELAILLSVLLIGAFLNLGLLVSSLMKQATPALVILLLAWVFLYGVFPRLSSAAAGILFPVKSEAQLDLEKAQMKKNVYKERDADINRLLRATGDGVIGQPSQPGTTQEEIQNRYQSKFEESWRKFERDVQEQRKRQLGLTAVISRLSPVSCFVRPMSELARTGWLEYVQFDNSVRRYADVLNREIFSKQKWVRTSRGDAGWNEANINAPAPVLTDTGIRAEAIVRNVLPDVLLLMLFNFVFFSGAYVAFLRYDVR